MRSCFLLPVLIGTALFGLGASGARAGSFLGPVCYGANYTYQYPNRSHNVFGCGPGYHCQAWHPFFRPGLYRRNRSVPNQAMPVNAMPAPLPPQAKPSL